MIKYLALSFCALLLAGGIFAQTSSILSAQETRELQANTGQEKFPVYRAYEYQDAGGIFNLFLCEQTSVIKGTDTLHSKLQAVCYLNDHGGWLSQWTVYDLIDSLQDSGAEQDIHFWTRYCTLTDIDKDKRIDPVLVYGTRDENGVRRVKIITFYKKKKYVIRATECDLDYCRTFKKDDSIRTLPAALQTYLDQLLERLRKEQGLILHNG